MPVAIDKPVADFEAQATSGQTFSLAALKGKQVVIYFYPKDSTPGCTTEGQLTVSFQYSSRRGASIAWLNRSPKPSYKP